jgi:hypothetical protein
MSHRRLLFGLLLVAFCLSGAAVADDKTEEKKDKKKEEKKKKGTVVGVLSAKGDNWIEVKADGEEKGRRYVPHWRGGAPDKGGGLDKEMIASFKKLKVGSRVRIEWVFEERPRVEKIEVLKEKDRKDKDDKKEEKK